MGSKWPFEISPAIKLDEFAQFPALVLRLYGFLPFMGGNRVLIHFSRVIFYIHLIGSSFCGIALCVRAVTYFALDVATPTAHKTLIVKAFSVIPTFSLWARSFMALLVFLRTRKFYPTICRTISSLSRSFLLSSNELVKWKRIALFLGLFTIAGHLSWEQRDIGQEATYLLSKQPSQRFRF